MERDLVCIECPNGCSLHVSGEIGALEVTGNTCPRGKAYALSEVTCPVRVVTSTVRTASGALVPVKTDRPVKKSEIFTVMQKINALRPQGTLRIGDVLVKGIEGEANLVVTGNAEDAV